MNICYPLLAILAVACTPEIVNGAYIGSAHKIYTKDNEATGTPIDFVCPEYASYPDPTECDHYIQCTTDLKAYRMACPPYDGNKLMWYVPESGPNPLSSCCDTPGDKCPLDPVTTTTPKTPGGGDDCKPEWIPGETCDPNICEECGNCDWYMRCDQTVTPHVWVRNECDFRADADGTIRVSKKLFWDKGGNVHGGVCVPWTNLNATLHPVYRNDPDCKPICAFKEHETCDKKYYYSDPDFKEDIWWAPWEQLSCEDNTKWSQDHRNCVWCEDEGKCNENC